VDIYRVEYDNGGGPYGWTAKNTSMFTIRMGLNHKMDMVNHPIPTEDFDDNIENVRSYFFGFDSRKALDNWFKGFEQGLSERGAKIAVYTCPKDYVHIGKSGKQLIFKKEFAKRKATLDLV